MPKVDISELAKKYNVDEAELEDFYTKFLKYDEKNTGTVYKHLVDDVYREMGIDTDERVKAFILEDLEKKKLVYPEFEPCVDIYV